VTGGGTATATVVTNYTDLKSALTSSSVKVVHVSGSITVPSGGRISMQDLSGKTVYGLPGSKIVSSDLTKDGSGILYVKRCSNVIFRNLTFEGPGAYDTDGWDNMALDNCTNIWVDHCEFRDGMDGNLDIKSASDYITVTWCKFIYLKAPIPGGPGGSDDHRFSNLFGSSDGATGDRGKLRITMQHNWWAQGCKERMPRVRFGKVHMVNNLFNSTVSNQCIMAGFEADLLVESNVFENAKNPISKMDNTFTAITERNNIYTNSTVAKGSGTAFTPPYSLTVTPADQVKSKVTAGAGATLTSPNCQVTTNQSPTVSITSPANNESFTAPATVVINATAADADGQVTQVQFFNGSTSLGTDASSPYSFTWSNVAAGTYKIKAVATDNANAITTSSEVTIVVNAAGNYSPVVSVTSPLNNAAFNAPANITINASASDSDGQVSTVQFYNGTNLLGSAATIPYSYTWTGVEAGTYSITAVATDNKGAKTTSAVVTVVVNSMTAQPAVLTKRGAGSSTQTVNLGSSIAGFSYEWANASGVTVTGMPSGVKVVTDPSAKTVTFSGTPEQAGTYKFTVTTTGGSPDASKTGTITVVSEVITAIDHELSKSDWMVFPNPTKDFVTLGKKGASARIKVFNSAGVMISELTCEDYMVLGSDFPAGLYTIIIDEEDQVKSLKMVKE
jgi:pectate lyase